MACMSHFLLLAFASLIGAYVFFNATVMLISPKLWFRLPSWLAIRGTMTERKYANRQGYRLVRILGAIFFVAIVWMIYSLSGK
jgi:hypothetical protein